MTEESLKQMAHDIRCDVLRMYYRAGWGHIASALSCVDLLTAVYFGDDFFHAGKDHVVLSKGHATAAQYAILARLGMIERSELITFYQPHSRLLGLASSLVPGIDVPTGSLGQGLCFATGTSLAAKIDNSGAFTYVVLGDGEMQEGSVWEAAMFAGNQRLGKLIAIADVNGLQASGMTLRRSRLFAKSGVRLAGGRWRLTAIMCKRSCVPSKRRGKIMGNRRSFWLIQSKAKDFHLLRIGKTGIATDRQMKNGRWLVTKWA